MSHIPVVDLFAGPGGLNEGFSRVQDAEGGPAFRVAASFEMDSVACRTLTMRAAVRALAGQPNEVAAYREFLLGRMTLSDWMSRPSVASAQLAAASEVHQVELGPSTRTETESLIAARLGYAPTSDTPWVLIGGPPCQAYSLVGRARRTRDETFDDDVKHYLYREYLNIIETFRPHVFVMENVKGLLSHRHGGRSMFERIVEDLRAPGYEIRSFVSSSDSPVPSDFVIRAEQYGVPQKRHRVILLGIRRDLLPVRVETLTPTAGPSVRDVIGDMPAVRSRISPAREDDTASWLLARSTALALAGMQDRRSAPISFGSSHSGVILPPQASGIGAWLGGGDPSVVVQHEARGHMLGDLQRYAYYAAMAQKGRPVKLHDLPPDLLPAHRNVGRPDTPFVDRFRVQEWEQPSTTVVSHIAKDGHYFIHPDPYQMRALTVREAARLQTFPDDYFFCGNRTQQYHQVGNAVPPYLARQLGELVRSILS